MARKPSSTTDSTATPGRYVVAELEAQFAESAKLEETIRQNLKLLRA
jgi:hypothetical protein